MSELTAADLPRGEWEEYARGIEFANPVAADALTLDAGATIEWNPLPFKYVTGETVRHIDFDAGDDTNPGTRVAPWKHHPWDKQAKANAAGFKGPATYVFKCGVTYRGTLLAEDSGDADEPIRLTSDPEWGEGQAVISGSIAVDGGWQRLPDDQAKAAGLPETSHGKVWFTQVDLPQRPWAAWLKQASQDRERLTLARWPNWQVENPYNYFTQWFRVEEIEKGFPFTEIFAPKVLNDPDPTAFEGATVWMDHANTSGEFSIIGPFPAAARGYDPQTGKLRIATTHPRRHPNPNAPFFLENLPRFLDEPGEWYYSVKGDDKGRLYLRLPNDADPQDVTIELAQHPVLIDINGQRHIEISGLTLTGGNARDLNDAPRAGDVTRPHNFTQMAAVRLSNGSQHINLHHLKIVDTAGVGIVNYITEPNTVLSDITIADSRFARIDNDGIKLFHESAPVDSHSGDLMRIAVLRNHMSQIGLRNSVNQGGRGIDINGLLVGEIAGNVIDTTSAQGINIIGGRFFAELPLIRILIHRNLVRDTLLYVSDFGGIEFWGVGPAYIYNNISINPVGLVAHNGKYHKNQAYYFDHGAKGYLFNNIGWTDPQVTQDHGLIGQYFFCEIRNRWNQAFHNTAFNFRGAQTHANRHGEQQHYLANLIINCNNGLSHWRLEEAEEIAFARNIFAGDFEYFYNRWRGREFTSLDTLREYLGRLPNHLNSQVGWGSDDMPVANPAAGDFRPVDDSAVIDRGVKVFVPWSLAATVGEWHFRRNRAAPDTILDYDVFVQPFHLGHEDLRMSTEVPDNRLEGREIVASDYETGPLEDWVPSALGFDGRRHLKIPHARLVQPFTTTWELGRRSSTAEVAGPERKTVRMTDNDFIIEAVFRHNKLGQPGALAGNLTDDAGYALGLDVEGRLLVTLRADGRSASVRSTSPVQAGLWHHVLAEVDRDADRVTLYLDGQDVTASPEGAMPSAGVSLDNDADFIVGQDFVGAIDYLRVARSTLAESRTDIEELMAWQFNGPHLHDITGRTPTGGVRDVGAIEHPTVSGIKPFRFTPRESLAKPGTGDGGELKIGDDRQSAELEWGVVTAPKQARVGEPMLIQVAFGTETIDRPHTLQIDLHAFVNGKRIPGHGRAAPQKVVPGSTQPYEAELTLLPLAGMDRVGVVVFASPDGSFANSTVKTQVDVPVVGAESKPATAPAENAPAEAQGEVETAEFDWGTITLTKAPAVGDEAMATVTLKEGTVTEPTTLKVDMHWWKGKARGGVAGSYGRRQIEPGETGPFVFRKQVPDKDGIAAINAVAYLSPDGSWDKRTHKGGVGTTIAK